MADVSVIKFISKDGLTAVYRFKDGIPPEKFVRVCKYGQCIEAAEASDGSGFKTETREYSFVERRGPFLIYREI